MGTLRRMTRSGLTRARTDFERIDSDTLYRIVSKNSKFTAKSVMVDRYVSIATYDSYLGMSCVVYGY
jgi:hypothetical protein